MVGRSGAGRAQVLPPKDVAATRGRARKCGLRGGVGVEAEANDQLCQAADRRTEGTRGIGTGPGAACRRPPTLEAPAI